MKKSLVITALIAATCTSAAQADVDRQALRRAGVFLGSAIGGAVVAGPIGMVAAAGSGVWLDEQVEKAAGLETVEQRLSQAQAENEHLNRQLLIAENSARQGEQASAQPLPQPMLQALQLELLFKTGQSELTEFGRQRLAQLAGFMLGHGHLHIRLDGYADPRGDADYNLALSNDRVLSVARQLEQAGINRGRISTFSHGATQSVAQQGDIDSYALERVVRIEISNSEQKNLLSLNGNN